MEEPPAGRRGSPLSSQSPAFSSQAPST
jgi:hypothetical protein